MSENTQLKIEALITELDAKLNQGRRRYNRSYAAQIVGIKINCGEIKI